MTEAVFKELKGMIVGQGSSAFSLLAGDRWGHCHSFQCHQKRSRKTPISDQPNITH